MFLGFISEQFLAGSGDGNVGVVWTFLGKAEWWLQRSQEARKSFGLPCEIQGDLPVSLSCKARDMSSVWSCMAQLSGI